MKRLDGDGREIRGKACEYGRCVRDSLRKVLTVGHLGFVTHLRDAEDIRNWNVRHQCPAGLSLRRLLSL